MTRSAPVSGIESSTWRVNVSSVSVPDARPPYPSENGPLEDPHVVQTVYDLQFPGGGSIDDYIYRTGDGQPRSICATVFHPPFHVNNFPPNVTNRFKEDDNGNCAGVLGEDCVKAYLQSATGSSIDGCYNFDYNVPECTNTLRAATEQATTTFSEYSCPRKLFSRNVLTTRQGLGNGTAPNGTGTDNRPYNETQSGVGFWYIQTAAFNGSNTTELDMAENRLQVMVLSNFMPGQNKMLCQRVSFDKDSAGGKIAANWMTVVFAAGIAVMAILL